MLCDQLSSWMPVARASAELVAHRARKAEGAPCSALFAMRESAIRPTATLSYCSVQTSEQGAMHPTLRANRGPEVKGLSWRSPSPGLFSSISPRPLTLEA